MVSVIPINVLTDEELSRSSNKFVVETISPQQIFSVQHIMSTADVFLPPLNILQQHLFGNGVKVYSHNKAFQLSAYYDRIFNTAWRHFGMQVIKNLIAYGFIIVGVNDNREPYLWEPLHLKIEILRDHRNQRQYRLKPVSGLIPVAQGATTKPLSDVFVFETDAPELGFLQSKVAQLREVYYLSKHLTAINVRALANAANPPIVTVSESLAGTTDTLNKGRDRIATNDFSAAMHERTLQRDREQQAVSQANQSLYQRMLGNRTKLPALPAGVTTKQAADAKFTELGWIQQQDADVDNIDYYGLPANTVYLNPRINIEAGRTVATAPHPEFMNDITAHHQMLESRVASALNVPWTVWGGLYQGSAATNMTALNTLFCTVQEWRRKIKDIFIILLTEIYAQELVTALGLHYDEKTDGDLEMYYQNSGFDVFLPGPQDAESLRILDEAGWVGQDQMLDMVSMVYAIPRRNLTDQRLEPASQQPVSELLEHERDTKQAADNLDAMGKLVELVNSMDPNYGPGAKGKSSSASKSKSKSKSKTGTDALPPPMPLSTRLEKLDETLTRGLNIFKKFTPQLSTLSKTIMQERSITQLVSNPSRSSHRRSTRSKDPGARKK